MKKGDYYRFRHVGTVRYVGSIGDPELEVLNINTWRKFIAEQYLKETQESIEIKYFSVGYTSAHNVGWGAWMLLDFSIEIIIRDVGFALTAAVIVAIAKAAAIIGLTIIAAWIMFTLVGRVSPVFDPLWLLLIIGGAVLVLFVFAGGKSSLKTKKGILKIG